MLACARVGAVHTVIFGGFSAEAIRTASTIAKPSSSSPPTAAGGAARSSSSRPTWTALSPARPPSRPSSSSSAAATLSTWSRAAMSGGRRLGRRAEQAHREGLPIPSTRSSSSIRPAPPANRRACCTLPPGYLLGAKLTSHYVFDLKETDRYSAPPTSAGSPATATSSTACFSNGSTVFLYEGAPNQPEPTASGR